MTATTSQAFSNIHNIQPGEKMITVSVATTGAETATHTFDTPFSAAPSLVSLTMVGVSTVSAHCTGISTTAIAIEAVGGALTACEAVVQGKV